MVIGPWRWFYKFVGVLVLLLGSYFFLHVQWPGEEVVHFSTQELANIQTVITQSSARTLLPLVGPDSLRRPAPDSTLARVDNYIISRYEVADPTKYQAFLRAFADAGFPLSFLSQYPLKVRSYFWLTESKVLLEIIFWALFGVLASLFYYVSEHSSRTTFDPKQEYTHWAKLLYTPFLAIVIYFSVDSLLSGTDAGLNRLRHGLIILAFVLGFFSGRMAELLGKIKNLFLPSEVIPPVAPAVNPPPFEPDLVVDEATEAQKRVTG